VQAWFAAEGDVNAIDQNVYMVLTGEDED